MALTYHQRKLLAYSRSRLVTDAILWFLLFLLMTGFITQLLWFDYEENQEGFRTFLEYILQRDVQSVSPKDWFSAFRVILQDSILRVLCLIPIVYFNLEVLKKRLLDANWHHHLRYGAYFLSVVAASSGFTFFWIKVEDALDWVRKDVEFPLAFTAHFCFSLISTGLLSLRELDETERQWLKDRWRLHHLQEKFKEVSGSLSEAENAPNDSILAELELISKRLKDLERALAAPACEQEETKHASNGSSLSVFADRFIVGTSRTCHIVYFDDVFYVKGEANQRRIYTKHGKFWTGCRLSDFEQHLPPALFIRVNKSYVVAKNKVVSKEGDSLRLMSGEEIPIGGEYAAKVDADPEIGFPG